MTEATRFTNAWKVFNADIKRWAYQPGPAADHPSRSPARPPTPRSPSSTSTASPTARARRSSSSSSSTSAATRSATACASTSGATAGRTRRSTTSSRCLEEASGASLHEWARLWLRTASLNTLAAEWEADGGRIDRPGDPPDGARPTTRRCARTRSRWRSARERHGGTLDDRLDPGLDRRPETPTSPRRAATPCPTSSSRTTATTPTPRSRSIQRSLDFVRAHLDQRRRRRCCAQLLWMSLWEMVRDRELRSTEYLAIGRSELPDEPDLDILDTVLERSAHRRSTRYVPESMPRGRGARVVRGRPRTTSAQRRAATARSSGHARRSTSPRRAPDVERLAELVDGDERIAGLRRSTRRCAGRSRPRPSPTACPTPKRASHARRSATAPTAAAARCSRAEASRPTAERQGGGLGAHPRRGLRLVPPDARGDAGLLLAAAAGPARAVRRPLLRPACATCSRRATTRSRGRTCSPSTRPTAPIRTCSSARSSMLAELNGSLPTLSRQLAEVADELDRQIKVRDFAEARRAPDAWPAGRGSSRSSSRDQSSGSSRCRSTTCPA